MPKMLLVVYQVKDTIFWKQITTPSQSLCCFGLLFIKSKIQFFESKSQPCTCHIQRERSCLSSQRYNFLKANHNVSSYVITRHKLFIKSKIQFFESKSQQWNERTKQIRVVYQVKDTIFWKQITTAVLPKFLYFMLFIKSKIQFFESKSQPTSSFNG